MPEWVARLPQESRRMFEICLGRRHRVAEIDEHGHFAWDVGADVDDRFVGCANDLRLEAEFLEEIQ
jgi:hypothetical protein